MGMTYFKRYRMELDLRRPLFAPPPLPSNYELVDWQDSALDGHAEAKYHSFRFEIDANVFPCLADKEGCLRLMREIAQRDGFIKEATWLLIYDDGNLVDFCGTVQGVRDGAYGAIQNLGVTVNHRGHGLGTFLLQRSLVGFRSAGLKKAYLEVTAQNRGAVKLYDLLGFRRVKTVYKAADVAYA